MASNPMQRKARNSFLLGIIITLLITGIIIAFLFLQLKKVKDEQAEEAKLKVNVYTINQDVKSGQVLTEDMFSLQTVNKNTIPNNATSVLDVIDSWFLQTKDGQSVNRDSEGLYLSKSDSIIEIYSENGQYYKLENGEKVTVSLRNDPYSDDDGLYIADSNSTDTITRVYEEALTGNYYVYKLENSGNTTTRTKEYLEFNNVPVVAKVDMNANTVITPDLVVQSDEVVTDDVRREQYNMIILPIDLMTDDYVDIRLRLPNGQNFIVISKACIEVPKNDDGTYVADTIVMNLREDEILSLSSAIVEAYGIKGAQLYATKYTEPGLQKAATPTYTPNYETTQLIQSNPNIVAIAQEELAARYSQSDLRNNFIQSIINGDETYNTNVESGMDGEASTTIEARKKYLETLQY